MVDEVKTYDDLIATDLATRPNDGSFTSQHIRNLLKSVMGCDFMLQETTLSFPSVLVDSGQTFTEFRTLAAGSPYTTSQTNSEVTVSTTTGRATVNSKSAGRWLLGYGFALQPSTGFAFPDALIASMHKNYGLGGAATVGGQSWAYYKHDTLYLPIPQVVAGAGNFYCPPPKQAMVAESLVVVSHAGVASDDANEFKDIQVTNRGTAGAGTTALFTAVKRTFGDAITAKVPKVWTFNALAADLVIAANSTLELVMAVDGAPGTLNQVAIRGRAINTMGGIIGNTEEDVHMLVGHTVADLAAGDYVSVGGWTPNTPGGGLMKVKACVFWGKRIGDSV